MKETPPVFFWWGRIRIWQLEAMFNSKPEQFEYFFSASNGILYSFSDLKPSGFFDLPNIASGNNFHQINRRNLLILPRRLGGGMGKPRTLWHSISFIIFTDFFHHIPRFLSLYSLISFILDFSIFFWNGISWFFLVQYSSYHVYFELINDAALTGNLQDNA